MWRGNFLLWSRKSYEPPRLHDDPVPCYHTVRNTPSHAPPIFTKLGAEQERQAFGFTMDLASCCPDAFCLTINSLSIAQATYNDLERLTIRDDSYENAVVPAVFSLKFYPTYGHIWFQKTFIVHLCSTNSKPTTIHNCLAGIRRLCTINCEFTVVVLGHCARTLQHRSLPTPATVYDRFLLPDWIGTNTLNRAYAELQSVRQPSDEIVILRAAEAADDDGVAIHKSLVRNIR